MSYNISDFIYKYFHHLNIPATDVFRRLLITVVNSLDPDQARQNVGPDLDPNVLTLRLYS